LQDQVFSPLVFRGSGLAFDLHFQKAKRSRKHDLRLNIFSQPLEASQNQASLTTIQNNGIALDYSYTKLLADRKWQYYLGGGWYNFVSGRNVEFILEDEIAFDLFSSLNIVCQAERTFNQKHQIAFTISYPLLSYTVGRMRVPLDFPQGVFSAIADDPDRFPLGSLLRSGDLLTINNFIDLRTRVLYHYQLSGHWQIGMMYQFRYIQYPKFLDVQNGASQYSMIITYVF